MKFKKRLLTESPITIYNAINNNTEHYNKMAKLCITIAKDYQALGNIGASDFYLKRAKKLLRKSEQSIKRYDKFTRIHRKHERDIRKKCMKIMDDVAPNLGGWGGHMRAFMRGGLFGML